MRKKAFISFALLCLVARATPLPQQGSVTFNVCSWDDANKKVVTTQVTKPCIPIEGNHSEDWVGLDDGYYVVRGTASYKVVNVTGSDVHLILEDNATLNCNHVKLETGHSLSIYGQSMGDSKGTLNVRNWDGFYERPVYKEAAAIGGDENAYMGSLYIHGGTITARSGSLGNGAGIGGGRDAGIGGEVVVYGGYVSAVSDTYGASIGGGSDHDQTGPVTIYGGEVHATSSSYGAGIGGGDEGKGGPVNIYGGHVTASSSKFGAGIGGGDNADGGDVRIHGGQVFVCGGISGSSKSPAIGGHDDGCHGSLSIADNIRVTVGTYYYASSLVGVVTADQRQTACWEYTYARIMLCDHTTPTSGNDQTEAISYTLDGDQHIRHCRYCNVTEQVGHVFSDDGVCIVCGLQPVEQLVLRNAASNEDNLHDYDGRKVNTLWLQGRTLHADGSWNTLCLPFSLTTSEVAWQLAPSQLKTLASTSFDSETGTLTLHFIDATAIEAGKPYLIKWTSGGKRTNPSFSNVIIENVSKAVATDQVTFAGSFSPLTLTAGDKNVLYLSDDDKLYYPGDDMTLGSCRAYFRLNGLTAGDIATTRLLFDDDEATGVTTPLSPERGVGGEAFYTLDGRQLNGKPVQKGIYVHGDRKVVVK